MLASGVPQRRLDNSYEAKPDAPSPFASQPLSNRDGQDSGRRTARTLEPSHAVGAGEIDRARQPRLRLPQLPSRRRRTRRFRATGYLSNRNSSESADGLFWRARRSWVRKHYQSHRAQKPSMLPPTSTARAGRLCFSRVAAEARFFGFDRPLTAITHLPPCYASEPYVAAGEF